MDGRAVAKKSLKVAWAFAAATGVMALSAVVASGAAVGAIVEGFKAAGKAMKDVLEKTEEKTVGKAEQNIEEAVECEENALCETEGTLA